MSSIPKISHKFAANQIKNLAAAIFVIKEIMLLLWSFLLYSWVQVLVRVGSPEVVPSEGVRALGCSQTSGESMDSTGTWPPVNNCLFYGNAGTFEDLPPWHKARGFFRWGRSLNVHREIKRQSFTVILH